MYGSTSGGVPLAPELHDASTWEWWHFLSFGGIVVGGLEFLNHGVLALFEGVEKRIPIRGKHLDEFETIDKAFINFNKLAIIMFSYHILRFSIISTGIVWNTLSFGITNGPVALALMHIVYDLFYTVFHRVLHYRLFYGYCHKHHHRQRAPTRGNLDAINVHPFEFVVGEYLHLAAAYLVSHYLVPVHILSLGWFIIVGGILASLNHTRYDFSFFGVYSVKVHDVHHRLPESNYGQYIMLWDWLMGSYKPYTEKIKE
mmetsp:Transcript_9723/g.13392  ORF Transcript_9723/g.13392 Transcript_9723/m.13392 type:complete len:257 (+) Transcript_9723:146-916(+)